MAVGRYEFTTVLNRGAFFVVFIIIGFFFYERSEGRTNGPRIYKNFPVTVLIRNLGFRFFFHVTRTWRQYAQNTNYFRSVFTDIELTFKK